MRRVHDLIDVEKYLMHRRGLFPTTRRRKPYGWELDAETAAEVDRLFERLQRSLSEDASSMRR